MTIPNGLTLVTGGAGYVGSVTTSVLVESGRRVRVLDSLLHDVAPPEVAEREGVELVVGDVRDPAARSAALEGVESVVHLAAIVGDPACARNPDDAHSVNLEATRLLVREARACGVSRFVFASTCSNYGKLDSPELASESWPLRPVSLYAETKVAAELDVLAQGGDDFTTTCLRFATVYGPSPRMRFDLTVNEFTRDLALGRELVVYGERFWRPYVHVRDAARAVRTVLDAPPATVAQRVFNVGDSAENYRKLDLVEMLKHRFPEATISFVHRDEDPRDYRVSFDRIRSELDYTITATVAEGIAEVSAMVLDGDISDPFAPVYRN